MIDIIREIIPNKDVEYTMYPGGTINVTTKEYNLERTVPGSLYTGGVSDSVRQINDAFERDVNWLVIKSITEVSTPNRRIITLPIAEFSADMVVKTLLDNFPRRVESMRIVCSPETYQILSHATTRDSSLSISFNFNRTILSVPVITDQIPDNEIWAIDLNSWKLLYTTPENNVDYDFSKRVYVYKRRFWMSQPLCIGEKLIRIQLLTENREENEMRELMDRMRLPARDYIPPKESIWMSENPENNLCAPAKAPIAKPKAIPQLFNPTMVPELIVKKRIKK